MVSIEDDSFEHIKIENSHSFNPYLFCDTEYQPNMFSKRIDGHPKGGMSVCVVWNKKQAEEFFRYNQTSSFLLCLNEATMTMQYCHDFIDVNKFYDEDK